MSFQGLAVRTKLSPLRPLKRTIRRPRLTARILEAVDHRLTVLQAGAGYGKSTALAALAEGPYPVVWYNLDAEDAEPYVFLLYLAHGFRRALPALSESPLALPDGWAGFDAALPARTVLDTLINALAETLQEPTLLVLDDAHVLNAAPEALGLLERLIRLTPAHLHVILSTRYPLPLEHAVTWRARGEMLEIGEQAFAFTPAEIEALLADRYDPPPVELVELLAKETEGWPIALQLARQSVKPGPASDLGAALSSPSGLKDDLFAYLAHEVLEQQPGPLRDFMLATSVLRQMTAPACDHLRGADDSEGLLARLLEAGLFVAEMEHQAVRYHHLFREFLYRRLAPEARQGLHLRAAEFYEHGEAIDEAIHHYLQAGAADHAARLIRQIGRDMVMKGRLTTLAGWVAELPAATIEAQPAILIFQGDIARLGSRFEEALRWYEHAELACRAQNDMQGIAAALRGQARVYLDTVNPSRAEPLLREALRLSDGLEGRETRARLLDLLAENQLNQGRPEKARALQDEAHRLREEGLNEADFDARVMLRTGRLAEARHLLETRAEAERRDPVQRPRAHRETQLLLSFILACQGESAAAYQNAVVGTERGEALEAPFITAVGYMRQGHAWLVGDDPSREERARQCFEQAVAISDEIAVDRLKVEARWGLCRLYGFRGELDRAEEEAAQAIQIAAQAGDAWIEAMIRLSLGGAHVLGAQYDRGLESLARASLGFTECGDVFGETAVALWQSLAWYDVGDEVRLDHALDTLLERVQAHGYHFLLLRRTLLGPPDPRRVIPLLLHARRRGEHSGLAGDLLGQLRLDRLELHPGYQLRVQTLGAFRVWRGSEELASGDWQRDSARQLFHVLLAARGALLDRERIGEMLWPEQDAESAYRNFKVALNALYHALEPHRARGAPSAYVAREGSLYGLRGGADVVIDSAEFEREVARGNAEYYHNSALSLEHYRAALALYQGDYLEEFLYEEWNTEKRRQLREFALQSADRLARTLAEAGAWDEVIEVCRFTLSHEPCWEHAYRLLMRAYDQLGNRAQALRTYHRAVEALSRELDTVPSHETTALYESLLEPAPTDSAGAAPTSGL